MPILLELVRATSDTVWHGMNELGFHMPIRSFSHLLRRAIPLLPLLALSPLAAQESPQRQSGIMVEASAADAVQARDRALAQGRREAYARMSAATGAPGATASDAQIEAMVASIIIEQERVTSTRYTGRITVVFNGASGTPPAQPNPLAAAPAAGQPATSFIEATTSFSSLQQWMTLQRQVLRAGPVASLDIIAISTDAARMRLGLRVPQGDAPSALLSGGVVLTPPAQPGDIWRVGLGDG